MHRILGSELPTFDWESLLSRVNIGNDYRLQDRITRCVRVCNKVAWRNQPIGAAKERSVPISVDIDFDRSRLGAVERIDSGRSHCLIQTLGISCLCAVPEQGIGCDKIGVMEGYIVRAAQLLDNPWHNLI